VNPLPEILAIDLAIDASGPLAAARDLAPLSAALLGIQSGEVIQLLLSRAHDEPENLGLASRPTPARNVFICRLAREWEAFGGRLPGSSFSPFYGEKVPEGRMRGGAELSKIPALESMRTNPQTTPKRFFFAPFRDYMANTTSQRN
jgi:hypothetical protein